MAAANIKVNGVLGSDTDVPINTVVQLDNLNVGGEVSYTWSILDQPPLTADGLSAVNIQNPTFTPKKEGTYYIRLVVNQGLPSEQQDRVVVAVRQLKTLERIPAAGETAEADSALGWAGANNAYLRRIDALLGDPGQHVGVNASGGVLTRGDVLRASTTSTIKAGLPGQELLPGFSKALATTLGQVDEPLVVCEGHVDGSVSVANGELMKVRFLGRYASNVGGGAAAVGDAVYVTDTGTMSLVAGTVRRKVGSAMTAGATYDVWFAGVGGEDITPIDRGYLVYGNPGTLTNAHRVDGVAATPGASGGNSYLFKAADAATVPVTVRAGPASVQNLLNMQNSAGSTILNVTDIGSLVWSAFTMRQFSANIFDLMFGAGVVLRMDRIANTILKVVDDTLLNAELLLSANAANTRVLMGADDNTNTGHVGTVTATPFQLRSNNTPQWSLSTAGDLSGVGGSSLIRNVDDPLLAQDAATKNYIDVTFVAATHTWTALQTFQAGIVVTQSTLNGNAGTFTGNGLGAGVESTGGASAGSGGKFTGGAGGGVGVEAFGTGAEGVVVTGDGAASGILATGGATGAGGTFQGGATSGAGVNITGGPGSTGANITGGSGTSAGAVIAGSGAGIGAALTAGTAATGASPTNAAQLTNGNLLLSGTAPDATAAIPNTLTPANVLHVRATVEPHATTPVLHDGAHVASVATSGANNLRITFASSFASNEYTVTLGWNTFSYVPSVVVNNVAFVELVARDLNVAALAPVGTSYAGGTTTRLMVMISGRQ